MKLGFVFPGQGAQSVGMLTGFSGLPVVKDTFSEAAEVLGQDLWKLIEEGPAEILAQTVHTQPVMLATGVAIFRAFCERSDVRPEYMAGHSLGEYAALVASGCLDFSDALRLVRLRAELMQAAVAEGSGAMAAILGLNDETIREVCLEASSENSTVEAANYNCPLQVVIAGHREAVGRAMEQAKARGAKRAVLLPVSVPSHCSLLRDAALELSAELASVNFKKPGMRVLHNADVKAYDDPNAIRDALTRQLYSAVRWSDTILAFEAAGVTHLAEAGPGKVLTGINKRVTDRIEALALVDAQALELAVLAIG
ncbi:MAG: ACP S-malonyltransferase [Proteobacteria bacterium]|nr:ACP S-malonyltransferase [Pseudomonadota bacterium]MDE3207529.1 ACP S-malonyltransferase [Pseudomonadota bacterium]